MGNKPVQRRNRVVDEQVLSNKYYAQGSVRKSFGLEYLEEQYAFTTGKVNVSEMNAAYHTNDNKKLNTMGLSIIDCTPAPIVGVDHDCKIVAFNKSAQEMFGYTLSDVMSKNVSILMPHRTARHHDSYVHNYIKTGVSSKLGRNRVLFAKRKNGEEFPLEVQVVHAKKQNLFLGFMKETQVEHDLNEARNIIAALVNKSTIPVVCMDDTSIIRIASNSALETFGYKKEEMVGEKIQLLMDQQIGSHHDAYVQRYLDTGINRVVDRVRQVTAVRKNGERFPVELKVTCVSNNTDNSKYFIGYIRDMSAMVTQEEQTNRAKLADAMFPPSISYRLANNEQIHDQHKEVSILFADIVGFTSLSGQLSADKLVALLDDLFQTLDNTLLKKYQLEKVKTIGDCYMVASGIPHEHVNHANNIIEAGFEMIHLVEEISKRHSHYLPVSLRVRIGVNSGEVVAGIVGSKKPVYDCFGDAVNIASRMESYGSPMHVHISEMTYNCLRSDLQARFTARDPIEVKGKGLMRTYISQ
jgi:PAS domain S-box-containing protein